MIQKTVTQQYEDVPKSILEHDLERWKEDIEIINVEMIFYRNLITSHLNDLSTWNTSDYQSLFNGISDVQYFNNRFQKQRQELSNQLQGIRECDSLQCEAYFLNQHTQFKSEVEKHLTTYKNFKKTMFLYLRTKYNY